MEDIIMNPNKIRRREAIGIVGQCVLGCTALATIVAKSNEALAGDDKEKLDCSKEGKIDTTSKNLRKALKYVEHSKLKGQVCSRCMHWKAPKEGKQCGGCNFFTGPVNPDGYCQSFAVKKG